MRSMKIKKAAAVFAFAAAVTAVCLFAPQTALASGSSRVIGDYHKTALPNANNIVTESGSKSAKSDIPVKYDLRTAKSWTPNLKDQSASGMCWAFSSATAIESNLAMNGYGTYTLSPLQLGYYSAADPSTSARPAGTEKDTNRISNIINDDYNNFAQTGGDYTTAAMTLAKGYGAINESELPYSDSSMNAIIDRQVAGKTGLDDKYASSKNTVSMTDSYFVPQNNISAMKNSIIKYGAGEIGIYVIYNEQTNSYDPYWNTTNKCLYVSKSAYNKAVDNGTGGGHAVAVIGWNDNFSKDNFSASGGPEPSKDGAWLCQNSWSTQGSDDVQDSSQCFWVSYYDYDVYYNNEIATFYEAVPVSNSYSKTYQYDGTYSLDGFASAKKKQAIKSANVFKATSASTLKAVGYYNLSGSMKYSIQIYKNPKKSSDPTSGKAMLSKAQTGSLTYDGYSTIELKNDVSLSKGTKFAVVVTATSKKGKSYVATDTSSTYELSEYSSLLYRSSSSKGQSYYKKFGKKWTDYGKKGHNNVRIKAYVDEAI